MQKFWILIQEMDDFGHFAAYVRPVRTYENIISIFSNFPANTTANIYPTKKEAFSTAEILNDGYRSRGIYKWDYMEDGITPAPF